MRRPILLFLVALLAATASAATFTVGQFKYHSLTGSDVECDGLTANASSLTSITIPGRVAYNGTEYLVKSVAGSAFDGNTILKSVRIDWGIEELKTEAFADCSALTNVWLPSTLTTIGNYAFNNCRALTTLGFAGSTAPTVGTNAFANVKCDIYTPTQGGADDLNRYVAWANADRNGEVTRDGTKAYDFEDTGRYYVIHTGRNVSSYSAAATLVGVSADATYIPITSVRNTAPVTYGACSSAYVAQLTRIADYACMNNTRLTSIGRSDLGDYTNFESVGHEAFEGCTKLTAVYIPCGIIDAWAFNGCTALTTLKLYPTTESRGVTKISNFAFARCSALSSVYIPSSVTSFGGGPFGHCTSLNKITISSANPNFTVNSQGHLYSKDYSWLVQVGGANEDGDIDNRCKTINDLAFAGNTEITSIDIPYGVTSLRQSVFAESAVEEIKVPSSVTSVSSSAFSSTPALKVLYFNKSTIPSGVTDPYKLQPASGAVLCVPKAATAAWSANSKWRNAFGGRIYEGAYDMQSGNQYNTELFYTVVSNQPYIDTNVQSAAVAGRLRVVKGKRAWSGSGIAPWLTDRQNSFDIPSRVFDGGNYYIPTEIDRECFKGEAGLTSVGGCVGIKKVWPQTFYGCSRLNMLSLPNVTEIGDSALMNCAVKYLTINTDHAISRIGLRAFYNSGLVSLTLSVANVGSYAFSACQSLESLTLRGDPTLATNAWSDIPSTAKIYLSHLFFHNLRENVIKTWSGNTAAYNQVHPFYLCNNEWELISMPVPVTLPSSGLYAYQATSYAPYASVLTTERITGNVAAGTGMLVRGTVGTIYRLDRPSGNGTTYSNNLLKGSIAGETVRSTTTNTVFNFDFSNVYFSKVSSLSVLSGCGYLLLPTAQVNNNEIAYIDRTITNYDLMINGTQVHSKIAGNLSVIGGVTGTVTYNATTNTLTLNNATITSSGPQINISSSIPNLKISLQGTNSVSSTATQLIFRANTTISGSGSLTCTSTGNANMACFVESGTLTLQDAAKVTLKGQYGLYGTGVNGGSQLVMKGTATTLTANGTAACIYWMPTTLYNGLGITKPAGAYFNNAGTVVSSSGSTVKGQDVVISLLPTTYNLWINDTQVTNTNANNLATIDGVNGTVTYNPQTSTLTLRNATITSSVNAGRCLKSEVDGIIINLQGASTLNANGNNACAIDVTTATITGTGTLNATGERAGIVFHPQGSLTIDDVPGITLSGNNYGIYTTSPTATRLTIKGANTVLHATSSSSFGGAIRNIEEFFLEDGLAITEPVGGYFSDNILRDASGSVAKVATISQPGSNPNIRGDIDGNGVVDVDDLNILINIMLGKANAGDYPGQADIDGSGSADIDDLNILINIMLGKD